MNKLVANRRPRRRGRKAISRPFAPRPVEMLESPPFRVLSRAAHQVLARIEIEFGHHGGKDNGRLPVTYADFEKYGIHSNMIAPALRELEALGFIQITEHGCAGNAEFRRPSKYRLTYRHTDNEAGDGTHEWRRTTTIAQAEEIAKDARQNADPCKVTKAKKTKIHPHKLRVKPPPQTEGETAQAPPALSEGTCPPSFSEGTSISRGGSSL